MSFPDVLAIAVPGFVFLILIEMVAWRLTGRGRYETRDTAASLTMGLGSQMIPLLGGGAFVLGILLTAYEFRLTSIPNTWWAVLICFLVDDFRYYWWHRISHERRFFWASHVVHHSSQHYNLTTALRQTWTGQITGALIFKTPLVILGFHPLMLVFVSALNLAYQFWIHTEMIGKMGWFEVIFNTPSHHRVHHATNPQYLDANYAGTLIIWDRIFGTFVEEDKNIPARYGIIKNLRSFNPLVIAYNEWIGIAGDLLRARSLKEIGGYLLGAPGWSPDRSRFTSAMIKQRWAAMDDQSRADDILSPSFFD